MNSGDRHLITRKIKLLKEQRKYVPGENENVCWDIDKDDTVVARVLDYQMVKSELHVICEPIDGVYRGLDNKVYTMPVTKVRRAPESRYKEILYR